MKKYFFLVFISLTAQAEAWKINGEQYQFVRVKEEILLAKCGQDKKMKCQAKDALDVVSMEAINNMNAKAGTDRTGALCSSVKGTNVLGTDEKQNEDGFCLFKDGSVTSNHSLLVSARSRVK